MSQKQSLPTVVTDRPVSLNLLTAQELAEEKGRREFAIDLAETKKYLQWCIRGDFGFFALFAFLHAMFPVQSLLMWVSMMFCLSLLGTGLLPLLAGYQVIARRIAVGNERRRIVAWGSEAEEGRQFLVSSLNAQFQDITGDLAANLQRLESRYGALQKQLENPKLGDAAREKLRKQSILLEESIGVLKEVYDPASSAYEALILEIEASVEENKTKAALAKVGVQQGASVLSLAHAELKYQDYVTKLGAVARAGDQPVALLIDQRLALPPGSSDPDGEP